MATCLGGRSLWQKSEKLWDNYGDRWVAKCSREKDKKLVGVEGLWYGFRGDRTEIVNVGEKGRATTFEPGCDPRGITEAFQTNIKCLFTLSIDRT